MNVFDIIGPVMIGPSSSHTAGAARLGRITRMLLGEQPKHAHIYLHGSFARTYRGHGTDRALIGGLLGFSPDDIRIRDSLELAKEAGLSYEFEPTDLGEVHPNTALLEVTGTSGKTLSLLGSSIGGGNVVIQRIQDMKVEFTGEYYTLLIPHQDAPGVVANVTSVLSTNRINIAQMKVYRTRRGGPAMLIIETDEHIESKLLPTLEKIPHVTSVAIVEPF